MKANQNQTNRAVGPDNVNSFNLPELTLSQNPEFDGSHVPESWQAAHQRRATQPLAMSSELESALAKAAEQNRREAKTNPTHHPRILQIEWNLELASKVALILLLLSCLLWVGCQAANKAKQLGQSLQHRNESSLVLDSETVENK